MAGHSGGCAPGSAVTGRSSRPRPAAARRRPGGRAGGPRPPGARVVRRARRPCRGRWCRAAATGPQRSHASIGSATAPANAGPVSDHTATSPTAPGASTPSSPVAPEARGAAERRHLERHPRRRRRRAVAQLGQQHRLAGLQPQRRRRRPTTSRRRRGRRARRRPAGRRPGRCPRTRIRLLDGQWATPTPAAPSRRDLVGVRASRSGPATPGRCSQPVRSRYSVGRQPNVASENSSSSAFSAKWVCSRTSRRSASSAERTISASVTVNGEHGAERDPRPSRRATGRGGGAPPPRWRRGCRRRRRPRRRAAGRRPSRDSDIEPRVGWKRTPRSRAASISAVEQVAGAVRVEVEVVGRRRAARQRQLGQPDPRRQVGAPPCRAPRHSGYSDCSQPNSGLSVIGG